MPAKTTAGKWLSKHGKVASGLAGGFALDMGIEMAMGHSVGDAVKQASLEALLYEMFPSIGLSYMAIPLAQLSYQIGRSHYDNDKQQFEDMYRPNLGGNYQDTQQAYTMRQRGVQAIQNSRLNARSALGNTARMMHRL